MSATRIVVDEDRCEGFGFCTEASPELLDLDDDGNLVVLAQPTETAAIARAEAAVRVCPVAALKLAVTEG